jgi:hypothetical protein
LNFAKRISLFLGIAALAPSSASAGLFIEESFFHDLNSVTSSGADAYSRIFNSLFAGSTFGKSFFLGWNVNYSTRKNELNGSTSQLSGLEMGPRVGMFVNKSETLSIAVGVNPLVKATSTLTSGAVETWNGLGLQGEVTYAAPVKGSLWIGLKLVYNSVSYSQRTDASNVTSAISYTSSTIIPAAYFSFRFK